MPSLRKASRRSQSAFCFLPESGARTTCGGDRARASSASRGFDLVGSRSCIPRIRAHLHHRFRRLSETRDRSLSRDMESDLKTTGVRSPLQIMQSRGGVASSNVARRSPVRLFLSGPAAGVIGGRAAGEAAGFDGSHHDRYRRHERRHRPHRTREAADYVGRTARRLRGPGADGRCECDRSRWRQHRVAGCGALAAGRSALRRFGARPGLLWPRRDRSDRHRCLHRARAISIPITSPAAR